MLEVTQQIGAGWNYLKSCSLMGLEVNTCCSLGPQWGQKDFTWSFHVVSLLSHSMMVEFQKHQVEAATLFYDLV